MPSSKVGSSLCFAGSGGLSLLKVAHSLSTAGSGGRGPVQGEHHRLGGGLQGVQGHRLEEARFSGNEC